MFHKIKKISVQPDYIISLFFIDGVIKKYDTKPLIKNVPLFKKLSSRSFFNLAKVDTGGYGVSWDDELDISCDELWENSEV